ncbi:hypothetical protein CYMTET_51795 [Cymbomonas tetramitiformis]|uniref:HIT domain-containing protein n=1 Tax=Cymbomonas tetramitiformis TaxID=36881 RepID=A0AAE0BM00_9CHLO|nr:hypothetical protein CYMTET_51795 [Cymbomonas tetramitiformis]
MAEPACKKCQQVAKEVVPEHGGILFEDDLWIVVHKGAPIGVEGHLQLVSKRHFRGPADFNDEEAALVGIMLRHCQAILKEVSGAEQIYTAALGASFPHFHCHMVPVYGNVHPVLGIAWDVFLQEKLAADNKLQPDLARCTDIAEKFKAAIAERNPPKMQFTFNT